MASLIVNWVFSAVGLFFVALLAPGFRISEFQSVLIVALGVGLITSLAGVILKLAAGPGTLVVCALFLLLFDTLVFRVAALLVPGFAMLGFRPAFVGAGVLVVLQTALRLHPRPATLDSEGSLLES
jgi:uncharacterized membrane protein YvlD (DUF360 family)